MEDIYNALIMEHSMNSYNKKKLKNPDKIEKGHNPNCGDEIELEIKINNNKIEDMSFTGEGCAISQSSTSIMIDTLRGKSIEEANKIIDNFIKMIKREQLDEKELNSLEKAIAFKNISNMPERIKCVLLAWQTAKQALGNKK